MTKRDSMRFGWEADPTEHKRTYVKPNCSGICADDPATERKRTYVKPNCSGISGDDPEPPWRSGPGKRMEIRIVRGRVEVVEFE